MIVSPPPHACASRTNSALELLNFAAPRSMSVLTPGVPRVPAASIRPFYENGKSAVRKQSHDVQLRHWRTRARTGVFLILPWSPLSLSAHPTGGAECLSRGGGGGVRPNHGHHRHAGSIQNRAARTEHPATPESAGNAASCPCRAS